MTDVKIVGLDITKDANAPRAICVDCTPGYRGTPIKQGDEWGGDHCRCEDCGKDLDVTLVKRN